MIAHSIQISELLPDTFVKIILNNGKHKYGFLLNSTEKEESLLMVSRPDNADDLNSMSFESIDASSIYSIDPYLK